MTSSTATLSWSAPSGGAAGYVVSRDGTDSTGYGPWQSGTLSSSTTSFQFNSLVAGATYHLSVQPTSGTKTTVTATIPASSTSSSTTSTTAAPSTTSTTTVPSSSGSTVGVFTGPANYQPGGVNRFGTNTGSTVKVAVDYMNMKGTWGDFTNINWLLDPWTTWLKGDPSRKLVLSVPMLIDSAKGQYDNTSFDQYHRQIAQNIANRGIASQVVIRLGWEMNGTWYPWSTSSDGFKRMWRRLIPQYRAISSAFRFDWCAAGGSGNPETWYPGDDVVDIIAIDQYDIVWQHPGGDPNWRWSQIQPAMQWHANFAAAHGKKAAVDEWALVNLNVTDLGGGGDNPTYIRNMAAWGANHGYAWLAYFDVKDGGPNTILEENPNSLNTYRSIY